MKNNLLLFVLCCIAAITPSLVEAQIPEESRRRRDLEIPMEMRQDPLAGSSNKQLKIEDAALVPECGANYKSIVSYSSGKASKAVVTEASGDSRQFRLNILFNSSVSWAEPLRKNTLSVNSPELNALLKKYNLSLLTYYAADGQMDGLVLKFNDSGTNVSEAAKALSYINGVSAVYVKTRKK